MHRIYCPQSNFSGKIVEITDRAELHHLRTVLRLKKNDPVRVFDGEGREADGVIRAVSASHAEIQIAKVATIIRPSPTLILACAIPKKSKFEMIIEKATELGADEIIPLMTLRTEVRLDAAGLSRKTSRFNAVAVSAAKQSQRPYLPLIHPPADFPTAVERLTKTSAAIIPSLTEKTAGLLPTLQELKSPKTVSFLIGPEGDFTSEEYALAGKLGCLPVTLGAAVLKVETAAICVLSCAKLFFHR